MKTAKELKKDSKKSVAKKTTAKKNTAKKPAATKKVATKKTVAKKTSVKKVASDKGVVNKVEQPSKSNTQAANKNNKFAFAIVIAIVVLIVAFITLKNSFNGVNLSISADETSEVNNIFDIEAYNEDGIDELVLPEGFIVHRETSQYDSAVATIMNLISYYSKGESTVFDEDFILAMKSPHDPFHSGTCVKQIEEILETLNVKHHNNINYAELPELKNASVGIELLKKASKAGYPVVVGWSRDGMSSQWSLVVSYVDGGTASNVLDDEIVILNTDSGNSNENFEHIKVADFESKWDFGNLFVEEPEVHERAKNCFIILEKY